MIPKVLHHAYSDPFVNCPNCMSESGICVEGHQWYDFPRLSPEVYKVKEGGMTLHEWGIDHPGRYCPTFCLKCYKPVLVVEKDYPIARCNPEESGDNTSKRLKRKNSLKLYTGTGDQGKTSLLSGERVSKCTDRVEAYGDIDELNSLLGALMSIMPLQCQCIAGQIQRIQVDLMRIGAWLATSPNAPSLMLFKENIQNHSRDLEAVINEIQEELPVLNHFVIPGGHLLSAVAQLSRTVCRRAERHVVRLYVDCEAENQSDYMDSGVLVFLNRLSDYLFVVARYCNHLYQTPEIQWHDSFGYPMDTSSRPAHLI